MTDTSVPQSSRTTDGSLPNRTFPLPGLLGMLLRASERRAAGRMTGPTNEERRP